MSPWLRPDWPVPTCVQALSTLRGDVGSGASQPPYAYLNLGEHCGDDPLAVTRNRALLAERAQLPAPPRWLRQVHGTQVRRFTAADADVDARPEADAAVTADAGVVLAILSADCLPVLFCADDGREVAAAHAGWRGLSAGVLEATLASMRTPASRVHAWLGPAAGPRAYEVGADVRDAFVDADVEASTAFVPTRPGHWHADLYALARRRLVRAGAASIDGGDRCTISEPDAFHSHRRDGRSGRMATLVWIAPH